MTSSERRPNVLLVMTDQHNVRATGWHPCGAVATPNLVQLAESGVRFDQAHVPHPLCVPSRVSFWTGTYPHDHGARHNESRLSPELPNFARLFADAGYELALFGKNHCFGPEDRQRFDTWFEADHRGLVDEKNVEGDAFRQWMATQPWRGDTLYAGVCPLEREACPTWQIGSRAAEFVASRQPAGRPFLAWVSFPDPHNPLQAPEPYASRYRPEDVALPPLEPGELATKPERQRAYAELQGYAAAGDERFRELLARYYGMVEFVDDALGLVLQALRRSGQERETVVVFTADHGEYAAEHRMMGKSSALYDCLTRVPLVVSWPGALPQGRVVEDLVSTIDVMPTLAHLAGLTPAATSRGQVLPLRGDESPRDAVFSEFGAGGPAVTVDVVREVLASSPDRRTATTRTIRAREAEGRAKSVRTSRWRYVYDPLDPVDELYDLQTDPWELTNLARDPDCAEVVQQMRRRLLDWSIATEDALPVPLFFDLDSRTSTPKATMTTAPDEAPQYAARPA